MHQQVALRTFTGYDGTYAVCVVTMMRNKHKSCCDSLYLCFFVLVFFLGGTAGDVMLGIAVFFHTGYVFFYWIRNGYINLPEQKEGFVWLSILLAAIGTVIWGVDRGDSFVGVLRVYSAFAFRIALLQLPGSCRQRLLDSLPDVGTAMTVLAIFASHIPGCAELFMEGRRLAGSFQYANTYALFMLIGIVVLHHREEKSWRTVCCYLILAVGLYLSGSRTVWVLYLGLETWIILSGKKNWKMLAAAFLLMAFVAGISILEESYEGAGRFLTISVMESTFLGRLLYFIDALPMMLRYPFGMGYMGYFYMQQAMQTGVYRVRFVHNDILQVGLDYGFIVLGIFLICIANALLKKEKPRMEKELLVLILLGSLFDFHLQFQAILWTLILLMCESHNGRHVGRKCGSASWLLLASGVINLIFFLNGVGQVTFSTGDYALACRIAPWNSDAQLYRMLAQDTTEEAAVYAERIVRNNSYRKEAHQILAYYNMKKKDYLEMADEFEQAVMLDRFDDSMYEEFGRLLENAEIQCRVEGLENIGRLLSDKRSQIVEMKRDAIQNASYLAYLIDEKPKLTLQ